MNTQKTFLAKPGEIKKNWYVVDAEGKTLGRLASSVARMIMGKHKPTYTAHVDTGDYVIVMNADKIRVTGKRLTEKFYYSHSLHPGGFRQVPLNEQLAKDPERVIRQAVWGMIPKNRLARQQIKKLKVYRAGEAHPHAAQKPEALEL
ncbi:MAG TPA: 50S ribosomal protein L13 [Thermoflexales bacterium]|jgi:large subunit ribosomal protein L13|nr:50S ribosomal protein L13 [Thermoflexales bacterium]HQW34380.1 50S ribosomal protein L13 [Thermoflexales bacterium]HQX74693.1 50S ribosomal protein L13 [Thermoflexales bacterium]HQZ21387.1 50S ribosomal protein L13 [Thermoflexales bacterium]HQZ99318.1 50S ribosomal protein L13 [Thermoflexales bacterium]